MNTTKRLSLVAMILVAISLVLGNRAIPVQANDKELATPTPTGMPADQAYSLGNPASTEQQEELKTVIESYFEIRYRALSVAYAEEFQKNGFGDLVSDNPRAKTFLLTELSKLAVQVKHIELDHLRYVDYEYFLDFRNIVVDASIQMATVSVVEDNDVIYEISVELNPKDPIVSHTANIEHTIVLYKEQGRWRIVSDEYSDYLWKMLRSAGESTDEILRATDEMSRDMKASARPIAQSQNADQAFASTVPDDASFHSYDRAGAVNYALRHYNNYNPDYPTYDGHGGDCTNFVSQAIYEGGNASMFIPSPLPDPSPNGQSGWYLLDDQHRASAWNDVGSFYTFVTIDSWI